MFLGYPEGYSTHSLPLVPNGTEQTKKCLLVWPLGQAFTVSVVRFPHPEAYKSEGEMGFLMRQGNHSRVRELKALAPGDKPGSSGVRPRAVFPNCMVASD